MLEVFLLDTCNYYSSCCDRHFLFLFSVERILGLAMLILQQLHLIFNMQ